MEVYGIRENLFQFNTYLKAINLSFNQFLLTGWENILVHTGTHRDADGLIAHLEQKLPEGKLDYIFVSHFESDECGGLGRLVRRYPEAKVLCSAVTARQLQGFGIYEKALVCAADSTLRSGDFEFRFLGYPSEMHLWEGLLLCETGSGMLFSSDLCGHMGEASRLPIASSLDAELGKITLEKIPSPQGLAATKEALRNAKPRLIAPGHGSCIELGV